MSDHEANELFRRVRGRTLDCRTGILLVPRKMLGCEPTLESRYNVDVIDYVAWHERYLGEGEKFLRLDEQALLRGLDDACCGAFETDCLLVYNIDLALAYLPYLTRGGFWSFLRRHFRQRQRGLVISMPEGAEHLLPSGPELAPWKQGKRLARLS
jgi:hypothetical protein